MRMRDHYATSARSLLDVVAERKKETYRRDKWSSPENLYKNVTMVNMNERVSFSRSDRLITISRLSIYVDLLYAMILEGQIADRGSKKTALLAFSRGLTFEWHLGIMVFKSFIV